MMGLASRAGRVRLPLRRQALARSLPWIAALAVYLAALGGAGLLGLNDRMRGWDASLAKAMTLQVPADASAARLDTIIALLRQTHGIVGVHLLEPAETARLVEPWLGNSVPIDRLPVPRLIDLRVDGANPSDFAELRQKLASIVPEAQLDGYVTLLGHLQTAADKLQAVLAAMIAAVLLVVAITAVSAARTGLLVHREIIDLLHLFGADDRQIADEFGARVLWPALLGGLAGAAAAALTILIIGGASVVWQGAAPVPLGGLGDWRVWLVLVGAAVVAGAAATGAARITVLRRLARMP